MEENEKLVNEAEFLNILEEQESTSQEDIVLGDGKECGEDGAKACSNDLCKLDSCKDDLCGSVSGRGGQTKVSDVTPQPDTYYYVLVSHVRFFGYYKADGTSYPLPTARGWVYNSGGSNVSAATSTMSAILATARTSIMNRDMLNNENYNKTVWYSGVSSTSLFPDGSDNPVTAGYIKICASATTHCQLSQPVWMELVGYSRSSQTAFTQIFNASTGTPADGLSQFYLIEKRLSLLVNVRALDGTEFPLYGAVVHIDEGYCFPQYHHQGFISSNIFDPDTSALTLTTGKMGQVKVFTSSTTLNEFHGYVKRIGCDNNGYVNFTASCNDSYHSVVLHAGTGPLDFPVVNYGGFAKYFNIDTTGRHEENYVITFDELPLYNSGYNPSYVKEVVTWGKALNYEGCALYFFNEELQGKPSPYSYTAYDINLIPTGSWSNMSQAFTFTSNYRYYFTFPTFTFLTGGTTGDVCDVYIRAYTIEGTHEYDNEDFLTFNLHYGQTYTPYESIDYHNLTGLYSTNWSNLEYTVVFYVRTNRANSARQLGGTYYYDALEIITY